MAAILLILAIGSFISGAWPLGVFFLICLYFSGGDE